MTGPQFDRKKNGSLYNRGAADSYYRRSANPHWFPNGNYIEPKITDLTPEEKAEYYQGYRDNTENQNFKEYD